MDNASMWASEQVKWRIQFSEQSHSLPVDFLCNYLKEVGGKPDRKWCLVGGSSPPSSFFFFFFFFSPDPQPDHTNGLQSSSIHFLKFRIFLSAFNDSYIKDKRAFMYSTIFLPWLLDCA
jgi:hypothetical protein